MGWIESVITSLSPCPFVPKFVKCNRVPLTRLDLERLDLGRFLLGTENGCRNKALEYLWSLRLRGPVTETTRPSRCGSLKLRTLVTETTRGH
jgi:hypothetical protein